MIDEYDLLAAVDDLWRSPEAIWRRVKGVRGVERVEDHVPTLQSLVRRGFIEVQRETLFKRKHGGKTLKTEFYRKRQ